MGEDKYALDIRNKLGNHDEIMVPTAIVAPYIANKILIQKRVDSGKWGLFGGGIKYNEKITDTAHRELFEETGLKANEMKMFGVFSKFNIQYKNKDKVNAFSIAFVCKLKSNQIFKPSPEDTIEAVWITEDEIEEIDFWTNSSREIAREAFNYLKTQKITVK